MRRAPPPEDITSLKFTSYLTRTREFVKQLTHCYKDFIHMDLVSAVNSGKNAYKLYVRPTQHNYK